MKRILLHKPIVLSLIKKYIKRKKNIRRSHLLQYISDTYKFKDLEKILRNENDMEEELKILNPLFSAVKISVLFSKETKHNNDQNNYALSVIRNNFSCFVTSIKYIDDIKTFIIDMEPQNYNLMKKIENKGLSLKENQKQNFLEAGKEVSTEINTFPYEVRKWILCLFKKNESLINTRCYVNGKERRSPFLDEKYEFIFRIKCENAIFEFHNDGYDIVYMQDANTLRITPKYLYSAKLKELDKYASLSNPTEEDEEDYQNTLVQIDDNENIKRLVTKVNKINILFKKGVCGEYVPIKNEDLNIKMEIINTILSDFDTEITDFNELEDIIEDILTKNRDKIVKLQNLKNIKTSKEDFDTKIREINDVLSFYNIEVTNLEKLEDTVDTLMTKENENIKGINKLRHICEGLKSKDFSKYLTEVM